MGKSLVLPWREPKNRNARKGLWFECQDDKVNIDEAMAH